MPGAIPATEYVPFAPVVAVVVPGTEMETPASGLPPEVTVPARVPGAIGGGGAAAWDMNCVR